MAQTKNRLRVIPLGGLDEVGKNMTVFEYGNDMVVIDAGIMFPDEDHPGVDLILPDFSYIVRNKESCAASSSRTATRTTRAHCRTCSRRSARKTPILGTKLTLGIVEGKLAETRHQEAPPAGDQGRQSPHARRVQVRLPAREPLDPRRGRDCHQDPARQRAAHRRLQARPDAHRRTADRLPGDREGMRIRAFCCS